MNSLYLKIYSRICMVFCLGIAVVPFYVHAASGYTEQGYSELNPQIENALQEIDSLLSSQLSKHPHEVCACVVASLRKDGQVYERYYSVCQSFEDLQKISDARAFLQQLEQVFERLPDPVVKQRVSQRVAGLRPLEKARLFMKIRASFLKGH